MAKSTVPAGSSDLAIAANNAAIARAKLDKRRSWLLECWMRTKIVDCNFDTFGIESLDAEVKATWGDWTTRKVPYDSPFNGGPIPLDYQDPDPSPLKAAVLAAMTPAAKTSSSACPTAWGKEVIAAARKHPGFEYTVQAKLGDCELARAIWKDWERLPKREPGKLGKVVGAWVVNALKTAR